MTFLNSILKNSKKYEFPFNHWEYNNVLSEEAIKEIESADIPDVSKHNLNYDGTRAIDGGAAEFREGIASGGKAIKFRCFVTKDNASQFPNLVKFINELQSKETCDTISKMINKDLSGSYVRLEVICDREGFWLKPHCDIKEKLMSGLIFVNNANESEELGTDFYNEKLEKLKQFHTSITMVTYLQVVQIHGMEWRRKKLSKKEDVFKSITLHLKPIGKLTKYFVKLLPLIFLFLEI